MAILDSYSNSFSKKRVNLRLLTIAIFCVPVTIIICALSVAVRTQGRREIVSDDFTQPRPRPTPKPTSTTGRIGGMIAPKRPVLPEPSPAQHYRFAASSSPNLPLLTTGDNIQQLGLTLWRLRPARKIDTGQRMLLRKNGKSSDWIPERIEMDTPLSSGERLRLSIESPREGYLYVVDRVLNADGKMGQARLIFPKSSVRGGDNRVGPGKLIDLPGQEDDPNYFTAQPNRGPQVGENLTIIVTTTPLDLSPGDQPLLISTVDIAIWENAWGSETERFEMIGGAGKGWTKEEKEASAASGSRQLTRDGPSPQTIYRIAATNKTAYLVSIRLSYAR